jgi:hypothetical protein
MTSWVVSDSGVLLATAFSESLSAQAIALWQGWDSQQVSVAAPELFRYEITAAIRKRVYRGMLTAEEANP